MRGLTLTFLASLMLITESSIARPAVHTYDARDIQARQASTTSVSPAANCGGEKAGRSLIGGRQNNGQFGGFGRGGGGRGGGRFGQGGAGGGANAGGNNNNAAAGGDANDAAAAAGGNTSDAAAAADDVAAGGDNNAATGGNNNNNSNGDAIAAAGGNNAANPGNGGNNNNNNNNAGGGGGRNSGNANNGGNQGDNSGVQGAQGGNNAAAPVAANENGAPGPAVPVLNFNGGTRLNNAVIQDTAANPNATANQAASATSNNNFIDFCVGQSITNGLQNKAGSCNPVPIGQIPSTQNMISTMFVSPAYAIASMRKMNNDLTTNCVMLGSFVNAQKNYYAAPQQIDGSGQVVGHAHIVLQPMQAIDDTSVLDPNTFTFFKGMDLGDVNGLSTIDVQGGVPAGAYRMCTIMSASNHQSVILPVAQRGAENTCSYFIAE
uniref:Uncharacterized protein n=1 Tax=Kwoniella bestiolae CBS 10118 TaxID=1296100 RepID=A0A1B9G9R8_9TREE|nr:hypothetical protein I302_02605 [Kwoniella bestiolae CBS 10118]OCF27759.1 hypothetical protein I302_02605 [Kwoniella bestiolae CBS 10118]